MSEGALWGTAAGALVGVLLVIVIVGLVGDPLLAVIFLLPGVVMGGGFGVVYGIVSGLACGATLRLGMIQHSKHGTPFTLDRQKLLGGIIAAIAAGLTGLALNGLQLDVLPQSPADLWLFVVVPATAAGVTMALRAPAIVSAGFVTTPPPGRRTSGPAALIEPPAV